MILALLILLLLPHPTKRERPEVTRAGNQIESYQEQNGGDDSIKGSFIAFVTHNPDSNSHKSENPADKKEKSAWVVIREWFSGLKWNDWLLVIGTWVLAGVGICQYILSRKAAKSELRAYVGIQTLPPSNASEHLRLEIKNYGKTPALNLSCWCEPGSPVFPNTVDLSTVLPPINQPDTAMAILEPDAVFHLGIDREDVSQDRRIDEMSGEAFFYYGRIKYEDTFGAMHWRTFCFRSHATYDPKSEKLIIRFVYHETGNESDDSRAQRDKKHRLFHWFK